VSEGVGQMPYIRGLSHCSPLITHPMGDASCRWLVSVSATTSTCCRRQLRSAHLSIAFDRSANKSHFRTSYVVCVFMNFRYKFRHHRSIPRPRFPIRVQNFGDLATLSVDYCILYSECPPYFYFRFVCVKLPLELW